MDARAAKKAPNPGANKVKHRLLASRSRIEGDGRALKRAFATAPVPGSPHPDATAAITHLRNHLATLEAEIQHQTGGGANGKKARQLTAQTIADTRSSLAKLDAASKATDQATAVKLINDGMTLLQKAKKTSRQAGKSLEGAWPL
ncbi:MAG: hypothetical protein ACRDNK_06990 [Solirubrobacteraceae bacterium]